MIRFPKHVIRQQREDNGTYIASGNPFCTCRLKIAIPFCGFQCSSCQSIHGSAVLLPRFLQKPAVIPCKRICRFHKFTLCRVKQTSYKQCMLHHNLIPEELRLNHIFGRHACSFLQRCYNVLVQFRLPDNVLDQQRIIGSI